MRFSTLLSALASTSLTTARIVGFYAPDYIHVHKPVTFCLEGVDYIQKVEDVTMTFGIYDYLKEKYLGSVFDVVELGEAKSNVVGNISVSVSVPQIYEGDVTITAALLSLYGVSKTPVTTYLYANVTIGAFNSDVYVGSEYEGTD
ncbi:hypothetical protein B0A48_09721 [Cryoendolithus antarcticus]|uniref:Uncharacterized protein n=1 Tax=Cryoendolithus antarcticus TaxID=1507870 RepID=A0A1V8T2T6_9PEZI|nr:hypothetical protein B0A48_09721 [Cryoendolithus antarcticus]